MKTLALVVGFVVLLGVCGVLASNRSTTVAAQPGTAAVVLPAANTAKAARCKSALQDLSRKTGVWRHYQLAGDGIATVEVGGTYGLTSFQDKQLLNQMMLCALTDGREDVAKDLGVSSVQYLDYRTHKPIAVWSPGLGLEVE